MQLRSKLPHIPTTIFTVMSRLAAECGAINLSQGSPDFEVDQELKDLVNHYVQAGYNQYAPMTGVKALREAIAAKKQRLYGCHLDPDTEITVTNGATEAIFSAISSLVHPGDEVIVFEPAYDNYVPTIRLNGGVVIPLRLKSPDYRIDWDEVRSSLSPSTRMIMINTPHNPSGTSLRPEDMAALQEIVADSNILILSDEVYQHLVYDGRQHESILRYPELYRRAIVTMSFGKTFHATGWRAGYAIAPPEITAEIRKVHQFNTFSINRPLQHALADYLAEPAHYLSLPGFFQRKRDLFLSAMAGTPFEFLDCAGTYFALASYQRISEKGDQEFARWLTREKGVAVIPISSFYTDGTDERIVRFCFAKTDEALLAAAEKLRW
ncbi:aminotransferase class I/II-fold pyridoxal phosphate-dependent enzyme [Neolewinella aurantiaca]|uniref:Aminotransferase class I/II-fold pyridoxal phosphate-dependent enzyme n=1 Tax=Neolewinella aurantiaca TaxID=2602767 RepID=A0A5C7FJU0_9BACT|nr:methionine aminotransferase [Neolewinella aurantiaca]TXF90116.1 aminotransferase class I/II-fold pyridoxal phosphate-dependent enzyme [Neolewinella aurantiaca]